MYRLAMIGVGCVAAAVFGSGCASTAAVHADSLTFHASTAWMAERPLHPTRRLQFRIPSHKRNVADAQLVVWNIENIRDNGGGRVIEMNIKRWGEQFAQDDGRTTNPMMKRSEYLINGMPVHMVDVSGRYIAESSPGSNVRVNKPGHRMLAAYVVAPQGDYIVKLVGPSEVVSQHAGAFNTFIKSARATNGTWDEVDFQVPGEPKTMLTGSPAHH